MSSQETTFRNLTPEQAAEYFAARGKAYPQPLYDEIFKFHGDRPRSTICDVGTGPGKVVFDLLPYFERGLGCDTGASMIAQAQKEAAKLNVTDRTHFAVAGAESCADVFPAAQVDLLTVAMAVHWFDMPAFYASAAKLLRPSGTLAMWTCSSVYVHPSVPRAKEIQAILSDLEDNILGPYTLPGNMMSRNAYMDLALPWQIPQTEILFDASAFHRRDWDLDGVPSAPDLPDGSPGPFLDAAETTLEPWAKALGSASMVIRWRESHPEKANTPEDAVNLTQARLREIIGDDGKLLLQPSTTLLLLRRA